MSLGTVTTATLTGVTGLLVSVEAAVSRGLPGVYVVGLGDAAVSEAKVRIKAAFEHCQLPWPRTKVVVSLGPAHVRKHGSHFDLAMAMAIMAAQNTTLTLTRRLIATAWIGELGLDGTLRPVPGAVGLVAAAQGCGVNTAVIPAENAAEAAVIEGMDIRIARTLHECVQFAAGVVDLPVVSPAQSGEPAPSLDMADVVGQDTAKKAAEIAAAGGHHMFMSGPPGSGKSLIAARLPTLLPALDGPARRETTMVHSLVGNTGFRPLSQPPFYAPHHTVTRVDLVGGGVGVPKPGAVSLAHNGVLFLDEVSEVPAAVLDCLRIPLESREVVFMRGHQEITYPARFQLVMASNQCHCGAASQSECRCTGAQRLRYLSNVSGPLWDRIGLVVHTDSGGSLLHSGNEESSAVIAQRVAAARERATFRWGRLGLEARVNADVPGTVLRRRCPPDESAMRQLEHSLKRGRVSHRGVDRTLRIAWTLADLAGEDTVRSDHLTLAAQWHNVEKVVPCNA